MVVDFTKLKFHTFSVEQSLKELKSSEKGLDSHEAEQRLNDYGFNELKGKEGLHPFRIFIQQFSSPLVWILLVALVISIVLNEVVDAIVIGIIVVANAIMGFIQEYKAEKSIEALKKMASPKARVLRNGKEIKIESRLLIPGDIIFLETGDKVPADARLIESHNLHVEEASLTGESSSVSKDIQELKDVPLADRKNMIFASTIISNGRARAVVVHTGMTSEIGKIAKMISESHEQLTPLQIKLRDLGKYLTIAVVAVAILVFGAGLFSGGSATEMFLVAIALAVAAIPEGLPAVITISLSIGVQRMIKKNALVRKLASVETLGSVDVICTDKTGTLTHNQMTVRKIWTNDKVYNVSGAGYNPKGNFKCGKKLANPEELQQILKAGLLCNDAHFSGSNGDRELFGDPTEAALIVSAEKAGLQLKEYKKRIDEISFSSERKMMTTLHDDKTSYTKGAADIIIERCDKILLNGEVQRLDRNLKKKVLEQNEAFAKEALRVLGFAYKEKSTKADAEENMIFVGLQAMIDPPREEVKGSIAECHTAGIRVIMITGDHLTTAKAIAAELGIKGEAVTGEQLEKIKDLDKKILRIGIFARVNPEHKLMIVKALKDKGHVVAMTGDGVNDAPALKKADIGISMGIAGTDVAKEASDMILTDDNFTSIVSAVEEGRGIFDNIRKFVNYLLSSNLGEISVILFASLFELPLPLTAIQILWVNLVTDGLPATALSLDPHSGGIMNRKPRPARESILSKELRSDIIIYGVLMGVGCLVLFWLYLGSGLMKAQTMAFTALVIFEIVRLQVIRYEYKLGIFSNKLLIGAVILSLGLQMLTIYGPLAVWFKTTPLELFDWGMILVASVVLWIAYKVVYGIVKKLEK
ncbi:calcium-translocating P-type ATPase, SERCA-type [Candidatus Woesearchaeota archaeon]|jgi:P-type Ca2+ transporter type 2C|nr:calcium-translocating P-type ATPase, SERCA-type [Candidatus Woesearchaeota archaeon]MBT4150679.1 calcium-translocating P-type ATPase, SERCA-type [Candidatus Woesearchaeota archaeon]MBT4247897.1 calcium-translocating P-type ATPase, SERCA-type [Candidatus Woesearchaeota archaeon]MBT4434321.1 calcium-translocating P-type ATPase, SERCA-type [Candidatus Woesearchaeota archaeon]